ncbi:MAG: hypothetical protein ACOYJ5_05415 [Acutalibacteraceae bacterium]|jgi:hypothetical protein
MKGSRKTEIVIISVCLACVLVGAVIAAFFTPQKPSFDAGQVSNICTMICDEMEKLEENTRKTDGYVNVNNLPALLDEMEQQAAQFAERGVITQYAREDACIRMELEGGIEYYYFPVMDDMMSTGAQADPSLTVNEMDARATGGWRAESGEPKEILTIEPFATDPNFVLHYTFGGRSTDKAAAAIAEAIPDEYAFPDANNLDSFSPEQVTAMEGKSVIVWYGHGGMTEKYGPTLESSVKQTKENLEKYASFINGSGQNSQMIISNRNLSYTHYFFDQNLADGSLEGSLVYLAACHSAESDALGQAFIDKGADLVIGHTNSVRTRYNLYMLSDFLQYLKTQKEDGSYPTAEEALAYAKEENGERDSISFGYGASVVLGYAPGESEYRLVNPDAEEEQPVDTGIPDGPAGNYLKENILPLYENTSDTLELNYEWIDDQYFYQTETPYLALLGYWIEDYNEDGNEDLCVLSLQSTRDGLLSDAVLDRPELGILRPVTSWYFLDENGNVLHEGSSMGLILPRLKEEISISKSGQNLIFSDAYDDDRMSSQTAERVNYNDTHVENVEIVSLKEKTPDGIATGSFYEYEREIGHFNLPEALYIRYTDLEAEEGYVELFFDGATGVTYREPDGTEYDPPHIHYETTGSCASEEEALQKISAELKTVLGHENISVSGCTWDDRWESPFFSLTDGTEPFIKIHLTSTNTYDHGTSGTTTLTIERTVQP